jgi:hypothetical protein
MGKWNKCVYLFFSIKVALKMRVFERNQLYAEDHNDIMRKVDVETSWPVGCTNTAYVSECYGFVCCCCCCWLSHISSGTSPNQTQNTLFLQSSNKSIIAINLINHQLQPIMGTNVASAQLQIRSILFFFFNSEISWKPTEILQFSSIEPTSFRSEKKPIQTVRSKRWEISHNLGAK